MKSIELKASMLTHMLYRLHYAAAITEYGGRASFGIADVYGLTDSGYTHEFEVKVSRADLAGELKAIEWLAKKQPELGEKARSLSKPSKHKRYLDAHSFDERMYVVSERPNKFSFVVPPDLQTFAIAGLKNTPYGLYVVDVHGNPECKKRAEYIHKEKADEWVMRNIMRKACTEVEVLRREQSKGVRCSHCKDPIPGRCSKCETKLKEEREYRVKQNRCWVEVGKTGGDFRECMERTSKPVA